MQFVPTLVAVVTISVFSFADAKYGYGHGGHRHGGHHGYDDPGYGSHVGYHPAPHAVVAKVPAVAEKVVDYHVR